MFDPDTWKLIGCLLCLAPFVIMFCLNGGNTNV